MTSLESLPRHRALTADALRAPPRYSGATVLLWRHRATLAPPCYSGAAILFCVPALLCGATSLLAGLIVPQRHHPYGAPSSQGEGGGAARRERGGASRGSISPIGARAELHGAAQVMARRSDVCYWRGLDLHTSGLQAGGCGAIETSRFRSPRVFV